MPFNLISKLINNDFIRTAIGIVYPPAEPWLKLMDFFQKIKDITNEGCFAASILSFAINHESKFNEYLKAFDTSKNGLLQLAQALDDGRFSRQPNITVIDGLRHLNSH